MIRHRPFGSGHPYQLTADQRVPPRPLAGEAAELRVLAARQVKELVCEWDDGGTLTILPLTPVSAGAGSAPASVADGSHLASAAARGDGAGAGVSWSVRAPALPAGGTARYRFRATGSGGTRRASRWYPLAAARWGPAGGKLQVVGTDRVIPGSVSWLGDADGLWRVRFAFPLAPGEHVAGFGERYDRLDQRGRRLDAVVFEQYKNQEQSARTYFPLPFAHVIGGDGWGFHLRTSRRTWFDAGASSPDRIWVEAELGGSADETLEVVTLDGGPAEVLAAYTSETGRPQPLPDWVHRLWISGNEWNTQARVTAIADRHEREGIPFGVLVIEAWSDESTFTAFRDARYDVHDDGSPHQLADFTFPAAGAWPDPKGMVDDLHRRDVKVLLWQIPLAKMRPPPAGQARADAKAMTARGYGVRLADGRPYRNRGWWFPQALMPDLTIPAAADWWLQKRRYLVDEIGIDGFKTDGGEHAWGADLRYGNGARGDDGNNQYPVHYAAAYAGLLQSCGKPPVTFSRAGFTGSAAIGCYWAGDQDSTWEAFRAAITAGLSAAACGVTYWGWDLAGFSGEIPDAELYLRATAMSCFAPIMQYHSEYNHHRLPSRDRTPWNIAERHQEPRVLAVFRRFAQLREALVPYLAAQASAGITRGLPLMRPLFLSYPHDEEAWAYPRQYTLGDHLLVAPVTDPGATTWTAHLPAGTWVDVWTGQQVQGPAQVKVQAPVDQIPVWCTEDGWPALRSVFADTR
jgi:alpha-glucosidase (family GH31 glycosyl hydrolase)